MRAALRPVVTAVAALVALGLCSERLSFTSPSRLSPSPERSLWSSSTLEPKVSSSHRISASSSAFVAACGLFGAFVAGRTVAGRRSPELVSCRAAAVKGVAKLVLIGGQAKPAPPVGPTISGLGLNIPAFCKEYNAMTSDRQGETVPVIVTAYVDKTFKLELKVAPASALLFKAAGVPQGSAQAGRKIAGTITVEQLEEVAKKKMSDLDIPDIYRAMKIIHGTARSSGIKVEGYEEWVKTLWPKPKSILQRYGKDIKKLPAPWGQGPPLQPETVVTQS